MNVEQARFNMIEQQIRPWDVLDAHVLDLLAAVRREDFVPPQHRALAFADLQIPLKDSEAAVAAGQVMLEPPSTRRCWKSAPAPASWPRCSVTARSAC